MGSEASRTHAGLHGNRVDRREFFRRCSANRLLARYADFLCPPRRLARPLFEAGRPLLDKASATAWGCRRTLELSPEDACASSFRGGGFPPRRLLNRALQRGILAGQKALQDRESWELPPLPRRQQKVWRRSRVKSSAAKPRGFDRCQRRADTSEHQRSRRIQRVPAAGALC